MGLCHFSSQKISAATRQIDFKMWYSALLDKEYLTSNYLQYHILVSWDLYSPEEEYFARQREQFHVLKLHFGIYMTKACYQC